MYRWIKRTSNVVSTRKGGLRVKRTKNRFRLVEVGFKYAAECGQNP
ncbi:MAG: hypothetical protein N3F10_04965 [Candidatus Bathyarchaeota archaeon]|nr:hypothetical protein [Candidatus Bathyarchaeota archaeon]